VAIFPKLAAPTSYRACDTDLLIDHEARAYWLGLFLSHADVQFAAARETGVDDEAIDAARTAWRAEIDAFTAQPDRRGRLDILTLDLARQEMLTSHGIVDEFRLVKARENQRALRHLRSWLDDVGAQPEDQRFGRIVHGMLAGNLFDLGVTETTALFRGGEPTFAEMQARVPARPWRYDDLDAASTFFTSTPPDCTVVFADNAGADMILGVVPFVRQVLDAKEDARVIIAANERPSLNDVTASEVEALIQALASYDVMVPKDRIRVLSTGTAAPLIDLSNVDECFAAACREVDAIVLVGMGRGIESNWSAAMTCPTLRVALVKDPQVARSVRGAVFDAVVRFDHPEAVAPDGTS